MKIISDPKIQKIIQEVIEKHNQQARLLVWKNFLRKNISIP